MKEQQKLTANQKKVQRMIRSALNAGVKITELSARSGIRYSWLASFGNSESYPKVVSASDELVESISTALKSIKLDIITR